MDVYGAMKRWGRLRLPVIHGLCACLLLSACGSLSTTDLDATDIAAAARPKSGTLQAEVDALARPMVDSGHTPGVAIGVMLPDGSQHFYGYGLADQGNGLTPDGDTLFAIGSLSKEYLAAVTALVVDEGVLSWDDTLEKLLPPGTKLSPDAAKITLLQLATHTSGLPRQPMTPQTLRYFAEYLWDGESFYRHFDTQYTLDYLADFSTSSQGVPQYSNIGYGLIGYILELHTGKTVDALLAEKITGPLGLHCTGYEPDSLPCNATRARGYAGDQPKFIKRGHPTPDWQFTHLMRGSAGLHSTARDLLTFASAHMKGQDTRFNGVLASNLRVRVPQAKEAAAVAWVVDDIGGEIITYQIGIVAGYTSYVGIDLAHHTAVVVLQNSFNWDNSVGHKILLRLAHMPQPG
ncbi:MAG TPA: serine hydrolase domain-containing protein [Patescibacteria group bacterium]|nr:serine hydrolase domain-containing protein [Patescibacteria group bacterium]